MKSTLFFILSLGLILLISSCGKNNESGKSIPFNFPPNMNPLTSTPYSYNGINVQQVLMQNPCINPLANQQFNSRQTINVPLTGFRTQVAPGDIFVGVTSYGDVAVVAGQAPGQPPLFVGYLCPRSFTMGGTGQLMNVDIGANTRCFFKPITAATIMFPGGGRADFRWLDGGTSRSQYQMNNIVRFAFPVCQ